MSYCKFRAWCFTLNNYTPLEYANIITNYNEFKYCVVGREEGTEKSTPHLQGYVYFKNPRHFEGVKSILGERIHLENSKGSSKQNFKYCTKEGHWAEYGKLPKQGERKDLEAIKYNILVELLNVKEVLGDIHNFQQLKFAEGLIKYQAMPKPNLDRLIYWFYGPTGSGKTRKAYEMLTEAYGQDGVWMSSRNLKWWDGYYGQPAIIIDEMRGDFCTFHELLRITDIYPFRVETKGSSLWYNAKVIIITSCFHPNKMFKTIEDKKQLLRRIHEVREFKSSSGTEVGGNTYAPPSSDDSDTEYNTDSESETETKKKIVCL